MNGDNKENTNNTPTSSSITNNESKKKADDNDEWLPSNNSDADEHSEDDNLSDEERSIDVSADNSEPEALSTQSNDDDDDVLSDSDSSLSIRGKEFDAYIKDNCAIDGGVPTVITIGDRLPSWRKVKNAVTSSTKSIMCTIVSRIPLPASLFKKGTAEEEEVDENQSIDSFNFYVQYNCFGAGLEGMSLLEMRDQQAVLSPEEQFGYDMGFIVAETGQPLRVTRADYNHHERSGRFHLLFSSEDGYLGNSWVAAAKYCGVERINLPHPPEAEELVKKLGFDPTEYAAAYAIEDTDGRKYYQLWNWLGETKYTNILLDIFETGDRSETVIAMAGSRDSLGSIIGRKNRTDILHQFFEHNKSGALTEFAVEYGGFTIKVHDYTKTFEEGIVHGMGLKVDSLKPTSRVANDEKQSGGKYAVFQTTTVNKLYWKRVDNNRIMAHARSGNVVRDLINMNKKVVTAELKDLKQKPSGSAWKCENQSGDKFEVYVYNEGLHGEWTCYFLSKQNAEGGFDNKTKGSKKKRKRNN